jgi:hypothetical protein
MFWSLVLFQQTIIANWYLQKVLILCDKPDSQSSIRSDVLIMVKCQLWSSVLDTVMLLRWRWYVLPKC